MTETFYAIIVVLTLAVVAPLVMVALSAALGGPNPHLTHKEQQRKLEPYESGVTTPIGSARERFSIKFYLVAILFIVFDVEAVFLFPWAINYRVLGLPGMIEMFTFIAVLFAGFIYIVKKGALKWE
ncbi:MAG: NADH:ubiquinone oxidoreductase subunit 3 [Cyanobacteria bacterium RYN_339]|nr:NADH:ubiquinone oxidoreductase subunit 3 [Cyanobacteria bacterium RYN_339]